MERVDVFILGSQVHGTDADRVDVGVLHDFRALELAEVLVEDGHGEEVGADGALEGGGHLDHPVDHLGAVLLAYGVLIEG